MILHAKTFCSLQQNRFSFMISQFCRDNSNFLKLFLIHIPNCNISNNPSLFYILIKWIQDLSVLTRLVAAVFFDSLFSNLHWNANRESCRILLQSQSADREARGFITFHEKTQGQITIFNKRKLMFSMDSSYSLSKFIHRRWSRKINPWHQSCII